MGWETTGVFDSDAQLEAAKKDFYAHAFSAKDMGLRKVVEEYLDSYQHLKLWSVRDSLRDMTEEGIMIGSHVTLVGSGLLFSLLVVLFLADGITLQDRTVQYFLGGFATVMLGGIAYVVFIIRDAQRDFRDSLTAGKFSFWVKSPDPQREKEARTILKKHGAYYVHSRHLQPETKTKY